MLLAVATEDRASVESALRAVLDHGEDHELEVAVLVPRSAERRKCALTIAAVHDQEGRPGALICVNDVTEPARLREERKVRATFDALTGCLNRVSVMDALDRLLDQPGDQDTAVIFIDIDRFKAVNDRLGHAAGDELLINLASLLKPSRAERTSSAASAAMSSYSSAVVQNSRPASANSALESARDSTTP